jgi:hypothetical protein
MNGGFVIAKNGIGARTCDISGIAPRHSSRHRSISQNIFVRSPALHLTDEQNQRVRDVETSREASVKAHQKEIEELLSITWRESIPRF